jgi:hypothetical protein
MDKLSEPMKPLKQKIALKEVLYPLLMLMGESVFQFMNPRVALQFQRVRFNSASRIWLLAPRPICYLIFEVFSARYPRACKSFYRLKWSPPLCLIHGKLPDPTLKPVIVTLRVHVFF